MTRELLIERLKDAIEGECDGLAIDDRHAAAILDYVIGGVAAPAEGVQPVARERKLRVMCDAIRPLIQGAVGTGHWGNGWPGYWPICDAALTALESLAPTPQAASSTISPSTLTESRHAHLQALWDAEQRPRGSARQRVDRGAAVAAVAVPGPDL